MTVSISDADYEDLVDRLERLALETGTAIYAWTPMPNDYRVL